LRKLDNKKALVLLNTEGTRAQFLSAPVVPPRLSSISATTHLIFLTSLWRRVRDRSYRLFCCMGTTHLFLLVSKGFLRPAAHEGVPRRRIHSELSPYIGSLSVAMSRTMFARRGSDFM